MAELAVHRLGKMELVPKLVCTGVLEVEEGVGRGYKVDPQRNHEKRASSPEDWEGPGSRTRLLISEARIVNVRADTFSSP